MYYFMYLIIIVSTILQDFPLLNCMGKYASSITTIITIVLFLLYILLNKKVSLDKYAKKILKLLGYLAIIDIISMVIIFLTDNLYAAGEYLPVKVLKGFMFFATNVAFFILLKNLQNKLTYKEVFRPFYITFIILFIVLIIEMINPNILNIFHGVAIYNSRIRLLTSEASYTSTLIVLNFVLAFFYILYIRKDKKRSMLIIAMLLIFLLKTTSKGLIIAFFISTVVILLMNRQLKMKYKWILSATILLISICMMPMLYRLIINDLTNYTSIITRLYCIINAIYISIICPFGVGNGLYLISYVKALEDNYKILNKLPFKVNTSEINQIINAKSDTIIGAKSGVFQYGIYWGIIGNIYFMAIILNIYRKLRSISKKGRMILEFGLVFLVLSIMFIVDFDTKYEIFAYLAALTYYIEYEEKIKKVNKGEECDG